MVKTYCPLNAPFIFALIFFSLGGGACHSPKVSSSDDLAIVREFCENTTFQKTDLAIKWQIQRLPHEVASALSRLKERGEQKHLPYLCILFLRDFLYQRQESVSGCTLAGGGRGKQGQRGRAKLGHLSPKNSAPMGAMQAKFCFLPAIPAACRPPGLLSAYGRP